MGTFILIGIAGLVIMIGGVWWLTLSSEYNSKSEAFYDLAFKILTVALGLSMQLGSVASISQEIIYKEFAKEVKLEQVSVKGVNSFPFEGKIIFKDGKIDSIVLKKGTTKKER